MLVHFVEVFDKNVECEQAVVARSLYGCAGICKMVVRIQELTAAVVGLDGDGSRTGIPHDLGIHRSLITF